MDRAVSVLAREYLPFSKIVVVVLIAAAASFVYRTPLRNGIDRYETETLKWRQSFKARMNAVRPAPAAPVTDAVPTGQAPYTAPVPSAPAQPVIRLSDRWNLIILWLVGGIIFLSVLTTGALHTLIRLALLTVFYFVLAVALFMFGNIALNILYPSAFILICFVILVAYHQIIIYVEKHRLMHLVTKDALTQLYNFPHFQLLLEGEIHDIGLRRNRYLSILMIDIDFFKKINDAHGHAAGDEVIRGVADVIRSNCRSLDVACRYGGEEFLLMLPGATSDDTGRIAEKIRKAVQNRHFYLGEHKAPIQVTASFGVATYYPRESVDNLIRRVDRALYKAKEAGRNMVCRI